MFKLTEALGLEQGAISAWGSHLSQKPAAVEEKGRAAHTGRVRTAS